LQPFFLKPTLPPKRYTLSLHDALPIYDRPEEAPLRDEVHERERIQAQRDEVDRDRRVDEGVPDRPPADEPGRLPDEERPLLVGRDRKSTRLNSSHRTISYAVFCLKKKK